MAQVDYVRISFTFAFFILIKIQVINSVSDKNLGCDQKGTCRCLQTNGNGIDMTPLENITATGFRFITYSDEQVAYFFHPCSDLPLSGKEQTACSDGTSLCFFKADKPGSGSLNIGDILNNTIPGTFYNLAYATLSVFQSSEMEVHIIFKLKNVTTTMYLECDESSNQKTALFLKYPKVAVNTTVHNLVLKSPYSCFRNLSHENHYLSGWSVFFIILITIAAAYFFGGMLVLRHIKGATGTEMIPNYDFWISLPGRIKSGFMRLINRDTHGPESYEKI